MAGLENLIMAKKKALKKSPASAGHDPHRVMKNGVARTLGMRVLSVSRKKWSPKCPLMSAT